MAYLRGVASQDDVEQLLEVGNESPSSEVKGPGSLTDKAFVANVARAVMAMGNRRDGGVVCVGIDEATMKQKSPGLDGAQAAEWDDYDNVAAALARATPTQPSRSDWSRSPSPVAQRSPCSTSPSSMSAARVQEDVPGVLQDGMTYVRPRGKPGIGTGTELDRDVCTAGPGDREGSARLRAGRRRRRH